MSRIAEAFCDKEAFIPFVTGGDPDLDTTEGLIIEMEKAGADLIEIGVPFSDPIAGGIVIQEANERALNAGCTTDKLFEMVRHVRETVKVPLVFFTYMNPVFTYGKERFMKACMDSGIDGVIIPDLPYEERQEISDICNTYGIDLIPLIAPTSNERIKMIAKEARGYIYCVSSIGVTGVRSEIDTDVAAMVSLVKEVSNVPVAVGFGISTPEQAAGMAELSDGVIVGSAIVKMVAAYGRDSVKVVGDYVREMKGAVRLCEKTG